MSRDCDAPWTLSNLAALAEKEKAEKVRSEQEIETANKLKGRLFKAVDASAIDDLKYLLRNGCFPEQVDKHGRTPLLRAARSGLFDVVRFMCAHGSEPDEEKDRDGRSAFYLSVMNNHLNISEWLLSRGTGNVNEVDDRGVSLMTHAALSGNIALTNWLSSKGAVPETDSGEGGEKRKREDEEEFDINGPPKKKVDYKKEEENLKEAVRMKDEGNQFLARKDYKGAIDCYTKAIKLDPKWNVPYSNRSAAHAARGDYELAVFDAAKCIELDRKWPKGYSRKATAHFFLKEYDMALKVYEAGLDVDPTNKTFIDGIASCKQKLGL